jgi:hypothetical protein
LPSKQAPRLPPDPPPPVRLSAPKLVIVLLVSTLKPTGEAGRANEAVAPGLINTTTPVLPVCASTGDATTPVQLTETFVAGLESLHAPQAGAWKTSINAAQPMLNTKEVRKEFS